MDLTVRAGGKQHPLLARPLVSFFSQCLSFRTKHLDEQEEELVVNKFFLPYHSEDETEFLVLTEGNVHCEIVVHFRYHARILRWINKPPWNRLEKQCEVISKQGMPRHPNTRT